MKSKLILIASVLIPFLYIMFYVWNTAGVTVFRDDIYLIKGAVIEKFCDRTLTFADLWRPTGGSRLLGYNLLQLANAAWFRLNSRLVVLLIPFVLLATACLLHKDYTRSLSGLCSPALIATTYALPMLLLFNLTLWEGLTFDYAIIFVWSVPWFLASYYALRGLLLNGSGISWLLAIVIPGLAVLVFGGMSSFAFLAALAITLGCYVELNRRRLPKGFVSRALAGIAVVGLIAFLYLYRINENDYFPDTRIIDWRVFANPSNVLRFVLATLAASVVGVDASRPYLSLTAIVALGSLVALVYALALILYFKTRMHERTYLPLFMIAYALAFLSVMTIGRLRFGPLYGMASRYTCSTICGIIAIVWICVFVLVKPGPVTRYLRDTLGTVIILIFAGLCWTSIVEWQTQPYRKGTFRRLAEIALQVDTASSKELATFEERPSLVRSSLRVLRKRLLNVYKAELPFVSMTRLSLPAGGACSISTSSSTDTVETGYATLEGNSAGGLSAAAVFSLVQNDVVVSEAVVPVPRPTDAARIFVDYRSGVATMPTGHDAGFVSINTALALVNCGPTAAHVTYSLRNMAGEILTTGHGIVESGAHVAKFIDQLRDVARDFDIPADFSSRTRLGSLDIAADQPLSITALLQVTNQRNEAILTTAPIADLAQPLNHLPAYFPQLVDGGGYATALDLLNTSGALEAGTFRFFDDSGAPLAVNQAGGTANSVHRYSIPSGGILHFQTDGAPAAARSGWALLTPDVGTSTPMGAGVIRCSSQGIMVTAYNVPAAAPTTHASMYVDCSGGHNTSLAIANVAKAEAGISIQAFQIDGAPFVGTSRNVLRLRPGGHSVKFAADLIPGLTAGFRGVLDISSTTPFAALALRSLKNGRNDLLLTALPAADVDRTASLPIVFPQIADGGGNTTELILLNAGSPVTATIKFLGEMGLPLAVVKGGRAPLKR
ncbi:MAG: hypothetical protein LAP85_25670 [Acidobacteriia bacterium]|nr:hypothetical protein [Terriglobia bacterium]